MGQLLITLIFAGFSHAAEIRVGHGSSIDEVSRLAFSAAQSENKLTVNVKREGGLTGDSILLMLDRGEIDLGISGNSWENLMQTVKKNDVKLTKLSQMKSKVLGKDRIRLIVCEDCPKNLSKDQVAKIFTAKVANWKELGGKDMVISMILPANTRATQTAISKEWLGGEALRSKTPKEVPSMLEAVKSVKTTKGAISFVSSMTDVSGVTVPEHPPLERDVTAIYLDQTSPEATVLLDKYSKLLAK